MNDDAKHKAQCKDLCKYDLIKKTPVIPRRVTRDMPVTVSGSHSTAYCENYDSIFRKKPKKTRKTKGKT